MFIKNVKDTAFSETRFVRTNLFQEGKTTAFTLNLLPGQSVPPHPHPKAQVYVYVVQGTGRCAIDEKDFPIAEQDVIHCAGEEKLGLTNTGDEPLIVYVVQAKE